jgi:hypothetical protein
MHFGGNDATVAHLLDANYRNLISGDSWMHSKHGIALYEPLNHLTQQDAARIAHGLLGARRHASPDSIDLYASAIHHMGYRFDGRGHIHKVHDADFSAAMKNAAFRAHIAVENDRAAFEQHMRHQAPGVDRQTVRTPVNVTGLTAAGRSRGLLDRDRSQGGGLVPDRVRGLLPGFQ